MEKQEVLTEDVEKEAVIDDEPCDLADRLYEEWRDEMRYREKK